MPPPAETECTDCGGRVLFDERDLFCESCGLVSTEGNLDTRPAFHTDIEGAVLPSAHGPAVVAGFATGSFVGRGLYDGRGNRLSDKPEDKTRLFRMRRTANQRPVKERRNTDIARITNEIGS